jgi:hypothetical protein
VNLFQLIFKGAAHYFKLAADQEHYAGQISDANLPWDGRETSKDLIKTVCCLDLAANQSIAAAQYLPGICLLTCLTPLLKNYRF